MTKKIKRSELQVGDWFTNTEGDLILATKTLRWNLNKSIRETDQYVDFIFSKGRWDTIYSDFNQEVIPCESAVWFVRLCEAKTEEK